MQANLAALQGRMKVVAIKENIALVPFADVVYGCDADWWIAVQGLPGYAGLKVAYDPALVNHPDWGIRLIEIRPTDDRILTEPKGTVGSGGNSAFHAFNLAVQWGVDRVLLIGVDCNARNGIHWYGSARDVGRLVDPDEDNFRRWRRAFAESAQILMRLGVDVRCASADSDLPFQLASVDEALSEWAL